MEVTLKRRDEIFAMPNEQLAFALAVCGVEFAGIEEGGPAVNSYSAGFLRQHHFKARFTGMSLTEAAQLCVKLGIHGNVTYLFRRSAISEDVIKAWDGMAQERRDSAEEGRAPEMPTISPTAMAQVLFVAANSTEEFRKVPFINRMAQVASTMDGTARTEAIMSGGEALPGQREIREASGKVWSIFGKSVREHLKV